MEDLIIDGNDVRKQALKQEGSVFIGCTWLKIQIIGDSSEQGVPSKAENSRLSEQVIGSSTDTDPRVNYLVNYLESKQVW